MARRHCVRSACVARARTTLTYDYANQLAVLGPLAQQSTPGAYDLCRDHAERLSAPQGWELVRLPEADDEPPPPEDDLLALADAIREVGLRHDDPPPGNGSGRGAHDLGDSVVVLAERGHLRVIADR